MLFKEIVGGRTNGRQTLKDHKSSLSTLCSVELKNENTHYIHKRIHIGMDQNHKSSHATCIPRLYVERHNPRDTAS